MALELVPKRFKKQFEYTTRALVTQLLQLVDDINEVIAGIYVRLTSLETPPGFVSVSGAYAITADDVKKMILVDTTGGAIAISIDVALTAIAGARVGIKKLNAQVSNFVTITPDSGTIDGAAAKTLYLRNQAAWLQSDGVNWFVTEESDTSLYGSTANGSYQLNADGTLECWHSVTNGSLAISTALMGGFRSAGQTWTYPKAFATGTTPVGMCIARNSTAFGGAITVSNATSASWVVTAVTSQGVASREVSLRAIGRWRV